MRKLVLSLMTLALFASPAMAGEFNKKIDIGQQAPEIANIEAVDIPNLDLSKIDASDTEAINQIKTVNFNLADLKDDVIVLVFLANHCPVVIAYEDRINEFVEDYKDKGVKVVAIVTTGQSTEKANNLDAIKVRAVKEGVYTYLYGYDKSQEIGRAYGATNTPQFFVLDKDHKIRYTGAMDDSQNESRVTKQYLRDAVDALLAGEEIPVKETRAVGCSIIYNQ